MDDGFRKSTVSPATSHPKGNSKCKIAEDYFVQDELLSTMDIIIAEQWAVNKKYKKYL